MNREGIRKRVMRHSLVNVVSYVLLVAYWFFVVRHDDTPGRFARLIELAVYFTPILIVFDSYRFYRKVKVERVGDR